VPYQRGAFYFADLDARLGKASGGKAGLHDFLTPVLTIRESSEVDLTPEVWSRFVSETLGEDEWPIVQTVHTEGVTFFPAPDSFGQCVVGERTLFERDGEYFEGMRWVPVRGIAPKSCFADD
jgi:hypothetical protein